MKYYVNGLLWIALISASISILLKIVIGIESFPIIYFAVYISIFALLVSLIYIAFFLIRNKLRNEAFQEIKKEIFLFSIAILLMIATGNLGY